MLGTRRIPDRRKSNERHCRRFTAEVDQVEKGRGPSYKEMDGSCEGPTEVAGASVME